MRHPTTAPPATRRQRASLRRRIACAPTLRQLVLEEQEGRWQARERVEAIRRPRPDVDYASLMFEPGDTVVTRSSLLGRLSRDVAALRKAPRVIVGELDRWLAQLG